MNAIKLETVCTIIETALIYLSDMKEEIHQKFHNEYLSSIFKIYDEHLEDLSPRGPGCRVTSNKVADK